jgi:NhaC family Na+:H+ antiporter
VSSDSQATDEQEGRPIPASVAAIPALVLVGLLYVFIHMFKEATSGAVELGGHLPLIITAAIAGLIAKSYGWSWKALEGGMLRAIQLAMGAALILLIIGGLMGSWLASGVVPALIKWGLELMSPSYFLPATCAVCSIVSLVSGSSWSTAGTVGLALIGVGGAMGIDPAMTAGAVISGAYFGDKLSPMSDTTNLAPAMAGTELFTHIRHMLWTTGPSWIIPMIAFSILGAGLEDAASPDSIAAIVDTIDRRFDPGLRHLIPPAVVGILVLRKAPALPSLALGVVAGLVLGVEENLRSGDIGFLTAMANNFNAVMGGFTSDTGNPQVDDLLSRGGISGMSNTVLLIFSAMIFGGVMEATGQLRALANAALKYAKSTGSIIMSTVLTSIGTNLLAGDQYIAVVVPGRMYADAYREKGLHPKNLSRALEDGGTITSPLIPWNTCGAFMSQTLGVATGAYLPYCFLNLLNPIISIIYGYTGFTIEKLEANEAKKEATGA